MDVVHETSSDELARRVFDVAIAALILVLAFFPLLIACIAIRLESPGSPILGQWRVKKGGSPFKMLKLRTMYEKSSSTLVYDESTDPRITKVGRWLRRHKFDEVPQLIHVLSGTMSLVGPRPMMMLVYRERFLAFPQYYERTNARPGITGLAALYGSECNHYGGYRAQWKRDMFCIKHQSIGFYFLILWRTLQLLNAKRTQSAPAMDYSTPAAEQQFL